MSSQTFRLLLIVLISVTVGTLIGYRVGTHNIAIDWQHYQVSIINKEPPDGSNSVNMAPFWSVLSKIEQNYYNKSAIDPQKIVNGAISGMVATLGDPYTLYLPPTQNNDFKQNLAGQFSGIGAELGTNGKSIVVIAPLDGSPAEKKGIKAGDTILKVDSQSTEGWNLSQTVEKIRGQKGTSVTLTIVHKGENTPHDVSITRDVITVKSVTGWVKPVTQIDNIKITDHPGDKVAYVRLSQFGDATNQDWSALVDKLNSQMKNDNSVKGMVFDLRNNPGGYLTDAVFIASEFIKSGVVVKEQSGNGEVQELTVNRKGSLTDIPLVVLINKGSASAAEIVSGALRDSGRAKLIGENSFGKGTVQQAEDLGSGAGLHVTIAKWLTPSGFWVGDGKNGTGLKPDVAVALDPKDTTRDTQLEKAVLELLQ